VSDPTAANIKAFAWAAGLLIALGMGWAELNARISGKAEARKVEQVEARLEDHLDKSAIEWRINRVLLCRIPEIRPDSYCEGYR
jgi:hypothetical protein